MLGWSKDIDFERGIHLQIFVPQYQNKDLQADYCAVAMYVKSLFPNTNEEAKFKVFENKIL